MAPPSQNQINFAKRIAERRNETLPPEVEVDLAACNAYIDTYKDSVRQKAPQRPSKPQAGYVTLILGALADSVDAQELERA